MNEILQAVYDKWMMTSKVKTSQGGWLCRNAVCCIHRGESQDKRGRGNLKIEGDRISTNCFNCGFKASYTIGRSIYPKFENFLSWLGFGSREIEQFKLIAFKNKTVSNHSIEKVIHPTIPMDIPDVFQISNDSRFLEYLKSRRIDKNIYPFLGSNNVRYKNRIIIPFIQNDIIIGFSARSIDENNPNRFIMKKNGEYVFGMDFVKPEHHWVIVTEGLFNALSVKGLAVLHNVISEEQGEMIHDLGKRIIVVPDYDKTGLSKKEGSLISTAKDYGWDVSFPDWECDDINEAHIKYGPLYVVSMILKHATHNELKIYQEQAYRLNKVKTRRF
jgi:hypothetical protein